MSQTIQITQYLLTSMLCVLWTGWPRQHEENVRLTANVRITSRRPLVLAAIRCDAQPSSPRSALLWQILRYETKTLFVKCEEKIIIIHVTRQEQIDVSEKRRSAWLPHLGNPGGLRPNPRTSRSTAERDHESQLDLMEAHQRFGHAAAPRRTAVRPGAGDRERTWQRTRQRTRERTRERERVRVDSPFTFGSWCEAPLSVHWRRRFPFPQLVLRSRASGGKLGKRVKVLCVRQLCKIQRILCQERDPRVSVAGDTEIIEGIDS